MRRWLLALWLLCGCAQPPFSLSVVPLDTRERPAFEDVQGACAMWGLDCVLTNNQVGAVTSVLTDRNAHDFDGNGISCSGIAPIHEGCKLFIWACCNEAVIAHEIGHAMGLHHVADPANIMHRTPGTEAEAWQERQVQASAKRLSRCVGKDDVP